MNIYSDTIVTIFARYPQARAELEEALGNKGISNWQAFAYRLPRTTITSDFLESLRKTYASDLERARALLSKVQESPLATIYYVRDALNKIGQGVLSCKYFDEPQPVLETEPFYQFISRKKEVLTVLEELFGKRNGPDWHDFALKLSTKKGGKRVDEPFLDAISDEIKHHRHKIFFKEMLQWPELSAKEVGEALKEINQDLIAHQYFDIPLERPPKPPVGIDGNFGHFLENTGMELIILDMISKRSEPNWETVAKCLAKQEPFRLRFKKSDIEDIKEGPGDNPAEFFLRWYQGQYHATVRSFVTAFYDAHEKFRPLCLSICEQAGNKDFYNSLSAEVRVPAAAQPLKNRDGVNLGLHQFMELTGIESEIIDALSKKEGPNWENVAMMLMTQPQHQHHINQEWIEEIKDEDDACASFLERFSHMNGSTIKSFLIALAGTSSQFKGLAHRLCQLAGDEDYYKKLEFPAEMELSKDAAPVIDAHIVEQMKAAQEALRKEHEELKRKYAELKEQAGKPECSICLTHTVTKVVKCGHTYCDICVEKIRQCAICRKPVTEISDIFFN